MSSSIVVVEVTKDLENAYYRHAKSIARHLRKADIDELSVISGCTPCEDVMINYKDATRKWIVLDCEGTINVPVALFGVTASEYDDGKGIPWMVATDGLKKIKKFLMEKTPHYIDIMKSMYSLLVNFVDARNTDSIKWLKKVGFTFGDTIMIDNLPFYRFYMECG
jgi:hypothetical protein